MSPMINNDEIFDKFCTVSLGQIIPINKQYKKLANEYIWKQF